MSLRSLQASVLSDDNDDLAIQNADASPPPPERTSDALARCMFDAVLTPRLRQLLKAPARLILIRTEDETAAQLLDRYLGGLERAPVVEAYTEAHKSGGRLEPRGRDDLAMLERGKTVVLISQDPERVLVPEAVAGADAVISVPNPNLTAVRKTIRAVTGGVARGLGWPDLEGLSLQDLRTAIRPGLTARECVNNLRRTALLRSEPPESTAVIPLEKLAMTKPVAEWALATLGAMRQVADGSLDGAALRFACLMGPPGTGKTTVAASLAASAGWRFVGTSVGEWFASSDGNLGGVVRAARRFFDELALSNTPVVGLIDEIESLPNRAAMDPSDAQWWTPVVTFVLTEIDKLRKSGRSILLLGATNHFQRLDAALVRPGRLEKHVSVLPPDLDDRRAMFANMLGDRIDAGGIATLARLAVLATPARIESWCKSAIAVAEAENRPLELRDMIDLVAPQNGRSAETDRAVALHEAGHAVVAFDLGMPVAEISILGLGEVGGWVSTKPAEGGLMTRAMMERSAIVMLAGRAADTILGSGAHAGAAADIEAVNTLLRTAMLDLGLYGSLADARNSDLRNWQGDGVSLWTAISAELARLYDGAAEIVRRRRGDIVRLVEVLLVERVVTGDRLAEIIGADVQADADLPSLPSGTP